MNKGSYLLSSAYFPPVYYFSIIQAADEINIENEENYLKQTYRNRCRIYSSNGPMTLSVPVFEGSFHKTPLKKIRIDYSKKWQHVHLGAIESSYRSSPFFEFYYDLIKKVISSGHEFLSDLNLHSINTIIKITGITTPISLTDNYEKQNHASYDFRYIISPKKKEQQLLFHFEPYLQVFSDRFGFIQGLSILDLIFNSGPDSADQLRKIFIKPEIN
jgi:hypothetical protein